MLHENYGINEKGHLTVCGADTAALAEKYGTPLYILDEDFVRAKCRQYKASFEKHFPSGSTPFFASKALSFVGIYRIIAEEGLGTDIVSPGELYTAQKAGFPISKTCFHGNNKTDADIEYGIKAGVGYFVVDGMDELNALDRIAKRLGVVQDILLRITPGIDPHTFAAVNTGRIDSKFGSSTDTGAAEEITRAALSLDNVRLCGYHCHIGSQIFESEPFCRAAKIMTEFSALIKRRYGYEAGIINLGGGFGVRYYDGQEEPDIDSFTAEIAEVIKDTCNKNGMKFPVIFMEPGRSIVGAAGVTVYTVGSVKTIPGFRTYVSVDGGMPDNPRYALYASRYTALIANKASLPCTEEYTVAGRCCESGDLIGEGMRMQSAVRGDKLAVLVTGAYNYSMASNYNRLPLPPIVIVSGGVDRLAVRRQSFDDLIRNELTEN
ncbi:MAG: diaminopimelate decarboxylase [Clostridia bacterium]|nr:diaminopimelate decarboxylase [Clostridia bacterium]